LDQNTATSTVPTAKKRRAGVNKGRNGFVHYQNYVAGWLDGSIHEFMEILPRNSAALSFALITSLDSNLNPASLVKKSPQLRTLRRVATPCKSGLLVPTVHLLEAQTADQIFFGFDEVWFFSTDQVEPKPESAWLVGPSRIRQSTLDVLGAWMSRNSCSLALGDGEGLNFIIKARGIVKTLLAQSLGQLQKNPLAMETVHSV
jgi:hypothetical protein